MNTHELIKDEIKRIKAADSNSPYNALFSCNNAVDLHNAYELAAKIKQLKPTLFLLVGIGGSNMGMLALVQAIYGSYYNHKAPLRFYCADTIDNDLTSSLIAIVEQELKNGGEIVLCVVTKSGTTSETIINGALFLELLKKNRPNSYRDHVVIITDSDSPLVKLAIQNNYHLLEIPKAVGGRFSVFTAVGLFPLMMLDIDAKAFCRGASQATEECLSEELLVNKAFLSAASLYDAYKRGECIHDIFVFTPDLSMLGNWYKQLIGESLGKKFDNAGNVVEIGITPTVSVGTIDLHSVAQLYLAGPRNRITTFVIESDENEDLTIPVNELSSIIPGLANRAISFVKDAIFKGVAAAYANEKRSYRVLDLKKCDEQNLGYAMMEKMIETIFLARLFNINAFDQPAVELYKKETRKILEK